MSDVNEKLRERALQIAQLNQKIQALEAQLGGSYGRANELKSQVETLHSEVATRDTEIQMLRGEVQKYKGALESVGREVQTMKAEQTQVISKKMPGGDEHALRQQLMESQRMIDALREDLKTLSAAASGILNDEPDALEELMRVVMEIGDPKYRILNLVLDRRSVRIDEIAALLVTDMTQAIEICESLQNDGELEIKDGTTVIPAKKYREVEAPVEEWKSAPPGQIYDSLEGIIERTEGSESVARALDQAAEILEQKLTRGGALMFEMRRTASSWHKQEGDREELKYKIREWKSRTESMS